MFREGFFEYAGIDSSIYDLHLVRIGTGQEDVTSGGGFELKTDTIPKMSEQLLYGKDYSAEPLEFEVEMCTDTGVIPIEQEIEIKNWLFGQDGWKTFTVIDEGQRWHLKCIFEPNEDIMSGAGLRGFRCTLKNCSPFWYGDKVTKTYGDGTTSIQTYYYNMANDNPIKMRDVYRRPEDNTYMCWTIDGHKYITLKLDIPTEVVDDIYCPEIDITTIGANQTSCTLELDAWQTGGQSPPRYYQDVEDANVSTDSVINLTDFPEIAYIDQGSGFFRVVWPSSTLPEEDITFSYYISSGTPPIFNITNLTDYPPHTVLSRQETEKIRSYIKSSLSFQGDAEPIADDVINVDTRYVTFENTNDDITFVLVKNPDGGTINSYLNQWIFHTLQLNTGRNNLYVYPCEYISKISFSYTPMYRLGAF